MTDNLEKERKATLAWLAKQDGVPEDALDELVHDLKSSEASDINNAGFEQQVAYVYEAMGEDAHNAVVEAIENAG